MPAVLSSDHSDPVRQLLEGQRAACSYLRQAGQLSFAIDIERELAKVFVLSAASYFEHRIVAAIENLTSRLGDERVTTLVRNKAIKRQYHTYFAWDDRRLGPFRTMFGDAVADTLKNRAGEDEAFRTAQEAFLEIGHQRNLIVHGNFATYSLPGTIDEWLETYDRAEGFVSFVEDSLSPLPAAAPGDPTRADVAAAEARGSGRFLASLRERLRSSWRFRGRR